MGKTFKITLGEREFTMHPFNFSELRRMADFAKVPGVVPADVTFDTFLMAMERAEPAIAPEDVQKLEFTPAEFERAMGRIMSGGALEDGTLGESKPEAEGQAAA